MQFRTLMPYKWGRIEHTEKERELLAKSSLVGCVKKEQIKTTNLHEYITI